jgi:hypothetical protein
MAMRGKIRAGVPSLKFFEPFRRRNAGPSTPSAAADSAQDDSSLY